MQKVLIIDDHQDIIDVLAEEITRELEGVQCVSELAFARAVERLASERPDAVVLDLLEGAVTTEPPGQRTWRSIWEEGRFCPVVIYTAFDGQLDPPVPSDHPFVKLVRKGAGTTAQVIEQLKSFRPLVASIQSLHREIDMVLQRVLRDTAGAAVIPGTDATHLVHAARRRVAALMDEETAAEGRSLFSWEQYLVPAFGDDPLTGDLIRRSGAVWNDHDAYKLVLSPSCDMVAGRNEPSVLVAKCSSVHAMKQRLSLPGNVDKAADRVRTLVLTQGHWNGFLPLPEFPSRVPLLVASLKDLEVVPYVAIKPTEGNQPQFDRIVSIDSPFREQVAWAFLSTVARPGMPDRDLTQWARDIVATNAAPAAGQAPPVNPG